MSLPGTRDPGGRRDRFFEEATTFTPLLAVDSAGFRFLVATDDDTVARSLFVKRGRGEMGTLDKAVGILRQLGQGDWVDGGVFVDVGANIGTSTITALGSYGFSRALACEPEPANHRLLKLNALLNDMDDRVNALPVAVSDRPGVITLLINPTNSGGHQVLAEGRTPRGSSKALDSLVVDAVSLDSLVQRGILDPEAMGMVWIDAQGFEGQILKGATAVVKRGAPVVLEFHPGMLEKAEGKEMLEAVIIEHYTHFIDLRLVGRGDAPKFELRPASEISSFSNDLANDTERRHTDILTVRIDQGVDEPNAG